MSRDVHCWTGKGNCTLEKNGEKIPVIESVEKGKYFGKSYCRVTFNGKYPKFVKQFVEHSYFSYTHAAYKLGDKYIVYMDKPQEKVYPYDWLYYDYDFSGDLLRLCLSPDAFDYIEYDGSDKLAIKVNFHKLEDDLYELDSNELHIEMKVKLMKKRVCYLEKELLIARVISKQKCKMLLLLVADYLGGKLGRYLSEPRDDIFLDNSVTEILETKPLTLLKLN